MKKKIIAIAMLAIITFSGTAILSGCGSPTSNIETSTTNSINQNSDLYKFDNFTIKIPETATTNDLDDGNPGIAVHFSDGSVVTVVLSEFQYRLDEDIVASFAEGILEGFDVSAENVSIKYEFINDQKFYYFFSPECIMIDDVEFNCCTYLTSLNGDIISFIMMAPASLHQDFPKQLKSIVESFEPAISEDFDINQKIKISDNEFEKTPQKNATTINNAMRFYGYPTGQILDTGNFVTLYYDYGVSITVSDTSIRITGNDSDSFPAQALAVIGSLLVDPDKADDYNNLVSTQILDFATYGEKSTSGVYSTYLDYDNFSILGILQTNMDPMTVSYTFFSK